ncbi:MAG: hypothetical protein JSV26_10920 [bacterium]|nr:MAG: hypothetical protein JSV26_10920 [bacterium]
MSMRLAKGLAITLFLYSALPWPGTAPLDPGTALAGGLPDDGVIVYQFHRRFRCEECYKLEKMITGILENHFPDPLRSGELVFRVVNLEEEENRHYETDYDFFYNTVIVVDRNNGRDARYRNIEEVWQLLEDERAVTDLVTSTVRAYLQDR